MYHRRPAPPCHTRTCARTRSYRQTRPDFSCRLMPLPPPVPGPACSPALRSCPLLPTPSHSPPLQHRPGHGGVSRPHPRNSGEGQPRRKTLREEETPGGGTAGVVLVRNIAAVVVVLLVIVLTARLPLAAPTHCTRVGGRPAGEAVQLLPSCSTTPGSLGPGRPCVEAERGRGRQVRPQGRGLLPFFATTLRVVGGGRSSSRRACAFPTGLRC